MQWKYSYIILRALWIYNWPSVNNNWSSQSSIKYSSKLVHTLIRIQLNLKALTE
jgi:hypothetical protein